MNKYQTIMNKYQTITGTKITSKVMMAMVVVIGAIGFTYMASNLLTMNNSLVINIPTGQTHNQTLNQEITTLAQAYTAEKSIALKTSLQSKLGVKLILRQQIMKQWANDNPRRFIKNVLSATVISSLPSVLQPLVEKKVTVSGELTTIHIDDFDHPEKARFDYYLLETKADGSKSQRKLKLTTDLPLISGSVISVTGYSSSDLVVVDTDNKANFTVASIGQLESVGNQKTMVLLVKCLDSGTTAKLPSPDTIKNELFGTGQFAKFYQEQSYGRVKFTGDVYGWYTVPRNCALPDGMTQDITIDGQDSEIGTIIKANNLPLDLYKRLLIVRLRGGSWSTIGRGSHVIGDAVYRLSVSVVSYNSSQTIHPFPWSDFNFVSAHEMGHALGLPHANGWNCNDGNILRGDCNHYESANRFDVIGSGSWSTHFNAFYKEKLGWLLPAEIINITQSGTYTLYPLETATGARLAKVYISGQTLPFLALENRRGIGFDSKLAATSGAGLEQNQLGILVNKFKALNGDSIYVTQLLDMFPPDNNKTNVLSESQVFFDPDSGVTLGPITKLTDNLIKFKINFTSPICVQRAPQLTGSIQTNFVINVGVSQQGLYIPVTNLDSEICGETTFSGLATNLPTNWSIIIDPASILLSPNFQGYMSFLITPPANVAVGSYSFNLGVKNNSNQTVKNLPITVRVIPPPVLSSLSPTSIRSGETLTLSGTNIPNQSDPYYIISSVDRRFSYNGQISLINIDDTQQVIFTFPTVVWDSQTASYQNTPSGDYLVSLHTGVQSNELPVTIINSLAK